MNITQLKNTCEICGETRIDVNPCYFCKKMICSKNAHFLPSKDVTIYGIKNKVIRVCSNCKPNKDVSIR